MINKNSNSRQNGKTRKQFIITLVISMLLSSLSSTVWPFEAHAASEKMIRVALFIDTGEYYRQTVPTVTLSGKTAMEIGMPGSNGNLYYEKVNDQTERRFSPDGYFVLAAETTSSVEAQQLAQKISRTDMKAEIRYILKNGVPVYQVVSGNSPNRAETEQLLQKMVKETGIYGELKGPYHVEAGVFSNIQEAAQLADKLTGNNFPAYIVRVIGNDGTLQYRVWAGNETSSGNSKTLAASIQKRMGISVQPNPQASNYLIMKQDAIISGSRMESVIHYHFAPGQKVNVYPIGQDNQVPLLQVGEKGNRAYRGMMELSVYNHSFTLINQVPLHEYLYGVVGSEMATGWPIEALKTQAVLARTHILGKGNKYGAAHTSDSVWDQAYYGYSKEMPDIRKAVDETRGEVILYKGKLAQSFYYSNAGGMTADGVEVWGTRLPYLSPVESPDTIPMEAADEWYQVMLADGEIGYVHTDFITTLKETNPAGFTYGVVNTDNLNFRSGPSRYESPTVRSLARGMKVVILKTVKESNSYYWERGPYTGLEVMQMINDSHKLYGASLLQSPVKKLEVTQYGPSGRVMEVKADGIKVAAKTPDSYRTVFRASDSSLRSTRFEIEQTGNFTVLGANGKTTTNPGSGKLYAVSGTGKEERVTNNLNGNNDSFVVYNVDGNIRVLTKQPAFLFVGYGYGHGFGMSQYGARAMAREGYDYRQILLHYYQGVTIEQFKE